MTVADDQGENPTIEVTAVMVGVVGPVPAEKTEMTATSLPRKLEDAAEVRRRRSASLLPILQM